MVNNGVQIYKLENTVQYVFNCAYSVYKKSSTACDKCIIDIDMSMR